MNEPIITATQKRIESEPITIEQIKESQKILANWNDFAIIIETKE